jgi:hypothetical protein
MPGFFSAGFRPAAAGEIDQRRQEAGQRLAGAGRRDQQRRFARLPPWPAIPADARAAASRVEAVLLEQAPQIGFAVAVAQRRLQQPVAVLRAGFQRKGHKSPGCDEVRRHLDDGREVAEIGEHIRRGDKLGRFRARKAGSGDPVEDVGVAEPVVKTFFSGLRQHALRQIIAFEPGCHAPDPLPEQAGTAAQVNHPGKLGLLSGRLAEQSR